MDQPPPPILPVDLARFLQDLVAFYDDMSAGSDPPIGRLDDIVTGLKAACEVPGPLGRDVALIAAGGGASRTETVAAIERIRIAVAADVPAHT